MNIEQKRKLCDEICSRLRINDKTDPHGWAYEYVFIAISDITNTDCKFSMESAKHGFYECASAHDLKELCDWYKTPWATNQIYEGKIPEITDYDDKEDYFDDVETFLRLCMSDAVDTIYNVAFDVINESEEAMEA